MPVLKAQLRKKEKANALRREGFVPAVVYGPTIESMSLAIGEKDLQALFARITRSSRIDLSIKDGRKTNKLDVFVKAIQYDPITDEPAHVDFYHPDVGHPLKLHVPLKVVGESPGVKAGGVLNVLFRTVRVHGLPKNIPHLVTADVSDLEVGEALRVRDLDFGEVEPLLPPERALVTVVAPRRVEVIEVEEELEEELEEEAVAEEEPTAEAEAPAEESAEEGE
jgi:large subunit ribosomal protein L25